MVALRVTKFHSKVVRFTVRYFWFLAFMDLAIVYNAIIYRIFHVNHLVNQALGKIKQVGISLGSHSGSKKILPFQKIVSLVAV